MSNERNGDFSLNDNTGSKLRAQLNFALGDISSMNSGSASELSSQAKTPGFLFLNTSTNIVYVCDNSNSPTYKKLFDINEQEWLGAVTPAELPGDLVISGSRLHLEKDNAKIGSGVLKDDIYNNSDAQGALDISADSNTLSFRDANGIARRWTPEAPDGDTNVQSDWEDTDTLSDSYIKNKPTLTQAKVDKLDAIEAEAEKNVQVDWNEASTTDDAYIKNKPSISGTSAFVTLTAYNEGDEVLFSDSVWRAILAIPASNTSSPAENSNWSEVQTKKLGLATSRDGVDISHAGNSLTYTDASDTIREYTPTFTKYTDEEARDALGISDDGATLTYKDSNDITQTFTPTNGDIPNYSNNTAYDEGSLVFSGNTQWRALVAILSNNSTVPAESSSKWSQITAANQTPSDLSLIGSTLKLEVGGVPTGTGVTIGTNEYTDEDARDALAISATTNTLTFVDANDNVQNWTPNTGVGEANVQSNWAEEDNTKDDYVKNKPSIPSQFTAGLARDALDISDNGTTLTYTDKNDVEQTWTPPGTGAGEANVQSDWNENDNQDDAYIKNKPTITGQGIPTYKNNTAYSKGTIVKGVDNKVWKVLSAVSDTNTTAPSEGSTWSEVATLSQKYTDAEARDALAISDSGNTLTYTDSSDVAQTWTPPGIQSDWNAISGGAQILNKPTIPTQYTDSKARTALNIDNTTTTLTYKKSSGSSGTWTPGAITPLFQTSTSAGSILLTFATNYTAAGSAGNSRLIGFTAGSLVTSNSVSSTILFENEEEFFSSPGFHISGDANKVIILTNDSTSDSLSDKITSWVGYINGSSICNLTATKVGTDSIKLERKDGTDINTGVTWSTSATGNVYDATGPTYTAGASTPTVGVTYAPGAIVRYSSKLWLYIGTTDLVTDANTLVPSEGATWSEVTTSSQGGYTDAKARDALAISDSGNTLTYTDNTDTVKTWTPSGSGGISAYADNTAYSIGDLVTDSSKTWRALALVVDTNTTAPVEGNTWSEVATVSQKYTDSDARDSLAISDSGDTLTYTDDTDTVQTWTPSGNGRLKDYEALTAFTSGDIVQSGDTQWRAIADIPSSNTTAPVEGTGKWSEIMTASQVVNDLNVTGTTLQLRNGTTVIDSVTIPAVYTDAKARDALAISGSGNTLTYTDNTDTVQTWTPSSAVGAGEANVQVDWNETTTTDDAFIKNKPTLHSRFTENEARDALAISGAGNTLTYTDNTDTVRTWTPSGLDSSGEPNVQVDWNETTTTDDAFIKNKPSTITSSERSKISGIEANAEKNVQADWSTSNSASDSYIKNKPGISGTSLFSANTAYALGDIVKFGSTEWRALQAVADTNTTDPTEGLAWSEISTVSQKYTNSNARSALNISNTTTALTYTDSSGNSQTFTPSGGGSGSSTPDAVPIEFLTATILPSHTILIVGNDTTSDGTITTEVSPIWSFSKATTFVTVLYLSNGTSAGAVLSLTSSAYTINSSSISLSLSDKIDSWVSTINNTSDLTITASKVGDNGIKFSQKAGESILESNGSVTYSPAIASSDYTSNDSTYTAAGLVASAGQTFALKEIIRYNGKSYQYLGDTALTTTTSTLTPVEGDTWSEIQTKLDNLVKPFGFVANSVTIKFNDNATSSSFTSARLDNFEKGDLYTYNEYNYARNLGFYNTSSGSSITTASSYVRVYAAKSLSLSSKIASWASSINNNSDVFIKATVVGTDSIRIEKKDSSNFVGKIAADTTPGSFNETSIVTKEAAVAGILYKPNTIVNYKNTFWQYIGENDLVSVGSTPSPISGLLWANMNTTLEAFNENSAYASGSYVFYLGDIWKASSTYHGLGSFIPSADTPHAWALITSSNDAGVTLIPHFSKTTSVTVTFSSNSTTVNDSSDIEGWLSAETLATVSGLATSSGSSIKFKASSSEDSGTFSTNNNSTPFVVTVSAGSSLSLGDKITAWVLAFNTSAAAAGSSYGGTFSSFTATKVNDTTLKLTHNANNLNLFGNIKAGTANTSFGITSVTSGDTKHFYNNNYTDPSYSNNSLVYDDNNLYVGRGNVTGEASVSNTTLPRNNPSAWTPLIGSKDIPSTIPKTFTHTLTISNTNTLVAGDTLSVGVEIFAGYTQALFTVDTSLDASTLWFNTSGVNDGVAPTRGNPAYQTGFAGVAPGTNDEIAEDLALILPIWSIRTRQDTGVITAASFSSNVLTVTYAGNVGLINATAKLVATTNTSSNWSVSLGSIITLEADSPVFSENYPIINGSLGRYNNELYAYNKDSTTPDLPYAEHSSVTGSRHWKFLSDGAVPKAFKVGTVSEATVFISNYVSFTSESNYFTIPDFESGILSTSSDSVVSLKLENGASAGVSISGTTYTISNGISGSIIPNKIKAWVDLINSTADINLTAEQKTDYSISLKSSQGKDVTSVTYPTSNIGSFYFELELTKESLGKIYQPGEIVSYNNTLWRHKGSEPLFTESSITPVPVEGTVWTALGAGGGGGGGIPSYSDDVAYSIGDIVTDNNKVWKALQAVASSNTTNPTEGSVWSEVSTVSQLSSFADLSKNNTWTGQQTISNIKETQINPTGDFTPDLSAGTVFVVDTTTTLTMPTAESGRTFTVVVSTGSQVTWAGSPKWTQGNEPAKTSGTDIYSFFSDGSSWYGGQAGQNFS